MMGPGGILGANPHASCSVTPTLSVHSTPTPPQRGPGFALIWAPAPGPAVPATATAGRKGTLLIVHGRKAVTGVRVGGSRP